MSEPDAFDVWWATYRENVEPVWEEGARLIARFAWDAATAAMQVKVAELEAESEWLRARVAKLEGGVWSVISRLSSHPAPAVVDGIVDGLDRLVRTSTAKG